MGRSAISDICDNVIRLDEPIDGFIGDDSHGERFNDWLCVGSAAECGRKDRLYGYVFIETDQDYDDFISQFDDDVYESKYWKIIKQHKYVFLVHEDDYDECGSIFSPDILSVEKFKLDFDIEVDIEDMDTITQTI